MLQLSGWLAGDVKESRNNNPTRDLQMAGRPNPASSIVPSGGIFAVLSRYAMLRNCWRSVVSTSTTQRSGAECRITAPELKQRLESRLQYVTEWIDNCIGDVIAWQEGSRNNTVPIWYTPAK